MPWRIARAAVNDQCAWYLEITPFFLVNRTPVYFHRRDAGQPARPGSLGNFDYLTSYDSWAGAHPCAITPRDKPHTEFESGAQIINHLLRHPEIQAIMHRPVSTAERDAVLLPAHLQTGLVPLESPPISRVIVTRAGLQIMRRRKTVLTNRAVRVGNAIRGHNSGPPWLSHRWVPVSRRRECRASATPVSAADRFVALEDRRTRLCIRRRRCRRSRNRGEVDTTPPTSSPGRTTAGQ